MSSTNFSRQDQNKKENVLQPAFSADQREQYQGKHLWDN